MIRIQIETIGEAFGDDPFVAGDEAARILREVADILESEGVNNGSNNWSLKDSSGRKAGWCRLGI